VASERLLVIDADLATRIATYLRERGRNARSAAELGLAGHEDPDLLRALAVLGEACTLITGDDAMPAEHGEVIVDTGATIATIHPEHPADVLEHYWRVDVVQRWAHAIQDQRPATVRRYSLSGSQVWRPRRRHLRMIRTHGWTPWQP